MYAWAGRTDGKVRVQRHDRVEIGAVFVIALRGPVHGGGQHAMLAIGGSISQDGVHIPGVVSVYDRPSCVLLSRQTVSVRSEVHCSNDCGTIVVNNQANPS
jgi:hypothetical protein